MSQKLEVGSIVEGKIVHIKPFGAIVSLGTVQGLVHISQVANSFVQDINDHVKVGDIVKVKVLSIDEETHKIALSIRDALPKEERPRKFENRLSRVLKIRSKIAHALMSTHMPHPLQLLQQMSLKTR